MKHPFINDNNTLDKNFYHELLYIIGLEEITKNSTKIIRLRKEKHSGSLIELIIKQIKNKGAMDQNIYFNIALELSLTWINRILFLKLLEAQLLAFHEGDISYSFLNNNNIREYSDLQDLFFGVLAIKPSERGALHYT